jgi:hypothetical protein
MVTTAMVLPTGQVKVVVNTVRHWQLPADGLRWEPLLLPVGDFQATADVMKMKDVNIYYHQDFQAQDHIHVLELEITHNEVVRAQLESNGYRVKLCQHLDHY